MNLSPAIVKTLQPHAFHEGFRAMAITGDLLMVVCKKCDATWFVELATQDVVQEDFTIQCL